MLSMLGLKIIHVSKSGAYRHQKQHIRLNIPTVLLCFVCCYFNMRFHWTYLILCTNILLGDPKVEHKKHDKGETASLQLFIPK